MKYKVIGWVYSGDSELLTAKNDSFAQRNAIIDEIRKHKYLFTGYDHQESWEPVVPVLNDGRKREFSQRGWGGVMAEAYGKMEDYDYSLYTFNGSIVNPKYPEDELDIEDFKPEVIENEHFEVNVTKELFDIAKTQNPFYLEDEESLRYIDANDTITIHCGEESLTFVVKDINRNKKEVELKNADQLIKGKYKVIVTHKKESEREEAKLPVVLTRTLIREKFEESIDNYDFETLKNVLENSEAKYIAAEYEERTEEIKKMYAAFVNDYVKTNFNAYKMNSLLEFVDDFDLYEKIAYQCLEDKDPVFINFINHYENKDVNMDKHILAFANAIKHKKLLFSGSIKILANAIALKPTDKGLCKRYYRAINYTRFDGLYAMAGANLFKYLRVADRKLIELENYKKYGYQTIMKIVEYLTYYNENVKGNFYPYPLPYIYENNNEAVKNGVLAYQNYIKERYDVDAILEDIILTGIEKRCYQMEKYFRGEEYAAAYVCAMDVLTNFKYNLKEKALAKYGETHKEFKEELENLYE